MALIKRIHHDEIEGVRFGKYNLADNSTAVIYRIGDTLIDTGPPNQWAEVNHYLSDKPISQVVLTHHHEDHSGNAARISKTFSIPVYVHNSGITPIQHGFSLKPYQKLFWGRPKTFRPAPIPEEIKTNTGHTLMPIHTPGHAPDHVCFLEPEKKWLFTGDLFLATRPKLFRADEALTGEINSLKKVLTHQFQTVFCAHKGVVKDGYDAIRQKLDYFLKLVHRVKGLYAEGNTVSEITKQVFGKKNDLIGLISLNHICYKNLTKECLKVEDEVAWAEYAPHSPFRQCIYDRVGHL